MANAILLPGSYSISGQLPLDARNVYEKMADMKKVTTKDIDDGHLSYCKETKKIYKFNAGKQDATTNATGYFEELAQGGGGTTGGVTEDEVKSIINGLKGSTLAPLDGGKVPVDYLPQDIYDVIKFSGTINTTWPTNVAVITPLDVKPSELQCFTRTLTTPGQERVGFYYVRGGKYYSSSVDVNKAKLYLDITGNKLYSYNGTTLVQVAGGSSNTGSTGDITIRTFKDFIAEDEDITTESTTADNVEGVYYAYSINGSTENPGFVGLVTEGSTKKYYNKWNKVANQALPWNSFGEEGENGVTVPKHTILFFRNGMFDRDYYIYDGYSLRTITDSSLTKTELDTILK